MSRIRARKRHMAIQKAKKRKSKIKKLRLKLASSKSGQSRDIILKKIQALAVLPIQQ